MSRCRTSRDASARSPPCAGGRRCCCSGRHRRVDHRRRSWSLARGAAALAQAGVGSLAIALDGPADQAKVRAAARAASALPVALASEEAALGFAILNRHLFLTRQPLILPTVFLLDAFGRVVKVYREDVDVPSILRDAAAIEASPDERLARALPFGGTFDSPPSHRNYIPYGRELLDQGLEAQAVVAFEQAAQGSPSASILYRLGSLLVKTGQTAKARAAYERALALQPDLSEASNDLGTLLAESGDLPAAIERFRAALEATPDYPDALNNLGYALTPDRPTAGGPGPLREGPEAPARSSRGAEQPRPHPGTAGRPRRRGALFPEGPAEAPRLRRGREQPGPRPRRPPPARGGDLPPAGVPREEPGVREHVHRACEDLPRRGSPTRRAGDDRAPPAAEPHSAPGSGAQAAVPIGVAAYRPTGAEERRASYHVRGSGE